MRFAKFGLAFGTLALGLVFAAGHQMIITSPTWLNGKELTPGDYKLQVQGNNVTIKGHEINMQVPAEIQTSAAKHPYTSFRIDNINGKQQLEEVDVGGTKTTIRFKTGSSGSAGGE
ncbi:MAG TPA: hypothetical protein VMH05_03100 [Bryobacteraceae bacterium]|nr:hypothetical protein [Bryobacteraceae bacterium]